MSRVLIIDDEASLRRLLRIMLERAGHTVLDAPDGREGMALWHREPTDVVVTDLFMPIRDGIHVLLGMKHVARKPKIIVMSGGGERGLLDWRADALALGADRVLVKPFDQGLFLATIHEVLTGQAAEPDAVPPSSGTDQRKSPRLAVSLPVYFSNGVLARSGTVRDISREGCRIQCPAGATDLKYFYVEIRLDELHDTLRVDLAVSRWSRDKDLGVEFIRMEPDQRARLLTVIRQCEEAALALSECQTERKG